MTYAGWYQILIMPFVGAANQSKQATDQDLLTHILRSIASSTSGHGERNISGLLQESQAILNGGTSLANSELVHPMSSKGVEGPSRLVQPQAAGPASQILASRFLSGY